MLWVQISTSTCCTKNKKFNLKYEVIIRTHHFLAGEIMNLNLSLFIILKKWKKKEKKESKKKKKILIKKTLYAPWI